MGELYAIKEQDFMEYLTHKMTQMTESGAWNEAQNKLVAQAQQLRDRPKPVAKIGKTTETKSWIFDPTIAIENDVKNDKGQIIIARGTRINPLSVIALSRALLFIDADDSTQVLWALKQDKALQSKTKIILVKGSLLESEKHFKKAVYFDQEGRLVEKFDIHHVPARIEQEGTKLRITEVTP